MRGLFEEVLSRSHRSHVFIKDGQISFFFFSLSEHQITECMDSAPFSLMTKWAWRCQIFYIILGRGTCPIYHTLLLDLILFIITFKSKPRFYNSTCMIIFVKKKIRKKNKNIRMQNVTCEMFKALFTRRTFIKYF